LKAIGLKPRNILVDVTNYLSFDRARPLHVYDADKLSGTVRARLGKQGEQLKALDGKTYEISTEMCVIADEKAVLGLGGVMGGEESGSSDATVNVLIESAWFDPLRTAQTGRATGINSDAKYRFERGVDPGFVIPGLDLATSLILHLCGGEPSEMIVAGEVPAPPAQITFDHERIAKLAGLNVPIARAREILEALGFTVTPSGAKKLLVTPPSFRRDVEGQADIVEEIARIHGYDKLPAPPPPSANGRKPLLSVGESRTRLARHALAAAGYLESVTWSFCSSKDAGLFGLGDNAAAALTLANPIAADLDCMRPTALPNLLRAAQKNLDRGFPDARLFEAGPAYAEGEQKRTVTAVWQPRPPRHWRASETPDVFAAKQDCLRVLEAMSAPLASLQAGPPVDGWWHPGRAGALKLGAKVVAAFGELHPNTLAQLDVEGPALAFEIWIDALPAPRARRAKPPLELSALMPLSRDFAFVVDDKIAAGDLVRAAIGADKQLIADVSLFDLYRGPGVPDGKKSLAIEVRLQPREKTLTEDEIAAVSAKIVNAVAKATGGTLRA
jgi:phenylalanyl-tRNA synthetase beta chain